MGRRGELGRGEGTLGRGVGMGEGKRVGERLDFQLMSFSSGNR